MESTRGIQHEKKDEYFLQICDFTGILDDVEDGQRSHTHQESHQIQDRNNKETSPTSHGLEWCTDWSNPQAVKYLRKAEHKYNGGRKGEERTS